MDAATAYWQGESGSVMEQWIVAGASKRGWTAWTVGACDPQRVVGIIPMVLDELNFVKVSRVSTRARACTAEHEMRSVLTCPLVPPPVCLPRTFTTNGVRTAVGRSRCRTTSP